MPYIFSLSRLNNYALAEDKTAADFLSLGALEIAAYVYITELC